MHNYLRVWASHLLLFGLVLFMSHSASALQGATGSHDPSTIVKRNGVYHVWTTGDQIYHMTSTDLINWSPSTTVFAKGTWPGWINGYVSDFKGTFWAPECVFRNGKYYMYYSCSMGQRPCAIGVATSTDLTTWTDQGMVIFSDNSTPYGCIDPAIFTDAQGRLWMAYGSHLTGNWIVELDPATGKRLNTVNKNIAGSSPYCENEASYVMQHGGYYYLFYNKGICCAGSSSTYYVQMGRSTNPDGPYLDKNGVDLLSGGGTNFLVGKDNYLGPGQVGLYTENGINFLTYHYYDGNHTGAPTLGIANLSWDATGWPSANQNWLADGVYTLANQGSAKVWAAASCSSAAGQNLVQSTANGQTCQQWKLTSQGSGVYKIANVLGNLNADVFDCGEDAGTPLSLYADSPLNCQKFRVERAADGTFVLSSYYGNRVVLVPGAATADGTRLALGDYTSATSQHWTVAAVGAATATRVSDDARVQLFPNPSRDGNFSVQLPASLTGILTIFDISGRLVHRQVLMASDTNVIRAGLGAGAYVVQITTPTGVTTRRFLTL